MGAASARACLGPRRVCYTGVAALIQEGVVGCRTLTAAGATPGTATTASNKDLTTGLGEPFSPGASYCAAPPS
jgi:hypothetical protein